MQETVLELSARGGRIAAGGGLFAGGSFAAGLIAGGLFASGLNAATHGNMTLKFTPVSNSNEHCIITNYQPLPENVTSFLLDCQLSSTRHSPVNNLF